ncbi:MAG: DUF6261 family protein [Bacteroidota bacterium]
MEIETLHSKELQNEEHIQFGTDFVALVGTHGADTMNIGDAYSSFSTLFANEQAAFMKILKSAKTEKLENADIQRDFTFRGLSEQVNSKCMHFEPAARDAAIRIKVVFDTFGNLARKSYDKETADINKLVAELQANYAVDMETIGITSWVARLYADNNAFTDLVTGRYAEEEGKTQLVLREVRTQVDEAYRKIVKRINSLIEINGDALHSAFVLALNLRIGHYNNLIAQRRGHTIKDKTPAPAEG